MGLSLVYIAVLAGDEGQVHLSVSGDPNSAAGKIAKEIMLAVQEQFMADPDDAEKKVCDGAI